MAAAMHGQFKRVPELIQHIPDSQVHLYEKCPTIWNVRDTSAFEKSAVESGLPDYRAPDNRNLAVSMLEELRIISMKRLAELGNASNELAETRISQLSWLREQQPTEREKNPKGIFCQMGLP